MSGRSRQILSRFPSHLEAARPGKVLGDAVEAIALDLDVLSARMAAVRRAHRLGEADELTDLLRIGALHGIVEGELEIVFMRFARAATLMAGLKAAMNDAARDAAAEALLDVWSIAASHPRLPLFAPPPAEGDPPDLNAARTRLIGAATPALSYAELTDAVRTRIATICRIHATGNATVEALLTGAANALDLEIGPIVHSNDRFWHAAPVTDRLTIERLVPQLDGDGEPTEQEVPQPLPSADDVIGIEENPLWRDSTDSVEREHGKSFTIIRRGFDRALLQIRITGEENGRTIGPMLVNRDEGRGVGFTGAVPFGKTLVFTEEGRALLEGADVTSMAYAWEGGCFAGEDLDAKLDFVFDGPGRDPDKRAATFVRATPEGALDREASFPGAGAPLPMPGIAVGTTRLVLFVQEAHLGSREGSTEAPVVRIVTPRTRAAFADGSVFAPGPAESRLPAAEVALSWLEHRAFAVRLLIPPRFRDFDADPDGTEVLRRTAQAVERFRPLGIELHVEFIDERWVLGAGVLGSGAESPLIERLRTATQLWEAPE